MSFKQNQTLLVWFAFFIAILAILFGPNGAMKLLNGVKIPRTKSRSGHRDGKLC